MADYTVISAVSRSILELLGKNMVPKILRSVNSIALSSPEENGNVQLYVYLYHISECRDIAPNHQGYGLDLHMSDSRFLYLYYQFTAFAASEIRFRALDEQNILGKVIQIFNDNHSLSVKDYSGNDLPPEDGIPISMTAMTQEEINKIWSSLQLKHKLALYYRAGPVELESEQLTQVRRVTEARIDMEGI